MSFYHHGSLHAELLRLATETIESTGVHALSLRDIARRAGVSHASPIHHFGTREGLLTELAALGFEDLVGALAEVDGELLDKGAAYVHWGVEHPGIYDVMWQSELLDLSNERLATARRKAWEHLVSNLGPAGEIQRSDALAAFALVHGVVQLARNKTIPGLDLEPASIRNLLCRLVPNGTFHQQD